jgi:hypothetical protein
MLKRNTILFIKLLLIIALVLLFTIIFISANNMSNNSVAARSRSVELLACPQLYSDISYSIYYDPEQTSEFLKVVQSSIQTLEQIDKNIYTPKANKAMVKELERLKDIEHRVSSDLDHYLAWEKEHYYAAKVWEYFMQRGFGEVVTSAIIGNMMIETSGGTLDLNPTIYSPSGNYYGLCQWSLKYCPGAKDLPFEYQLDYLIGSMPWEFNTFGKNYKHGFDYTAFLQMTDVEEAALAFTKCYERCGPASYVLRQEAAKLAYKYFNLNS